VLDVWAVGEAYESYIGRWSRLVAGQHLDWLAVPPGLRWLDLGCGTGALSESILEHCRPGQLTALDRSAGFLQTAARRITDPRVHFACADGQALPLTADSLDATASALVLNFIPVPELAVREMMRVVRQGGVVSAYVWDYAGGMQMLRVFWDEATALDSAAALLDEGQRFPLCHPDALHDLFNNSGLENVDIVPLDARTKFRSFEDYWNPFLGGQGPAPTYVAGLTEGSRARLRTRLQKRLLTAKDGSIVLKARAWAVRGDKK
jgi:SAM-dependent methyltransferase